MPYGVLTLTAPDQKFGDAHGGGYCRFVVINIKACGAQDMHDGRERKNKLLAILC